jgi:hypothetical protein
MTRQEWFNNQTKEVQQKFIDNCNKDLIGLLPSEESFFEKWVNGKKTTPGIGGAFVFNKTPEGYKYWNDIDDEFRENEKNQKKEKSKRKKENSKKE